VAIQILGSGGPIADDARACSAYLLWDSGKARVLVDLGGGGFLRFAESGARTPDLVAIAITHFHVDHVSDLPALLKSASFELGAHPLPVFGPTGGHGFPGLERHLTAVLGDHGAYPYLGWMLDQQTERTYLVVREVDSTLAQTTSVRSDAPIISAIGVPHGIVPALGYRVEMNGVSVVFTGDQRLDDESFVEFARGADLMVAHMAVGPEPSQAARSLHATPAKIGEVADRAGVRILVLSHFMARSLRDLEASLSAIRAHYHGSIHLAEDLDCLELPSP
jgi:ribonuclease BN (tRNA processing enzyme)